MIHGIVFLAVAAAAGFGVGRIKNAAKLAAISAEIAKVKTGVITEVDNLVTAIKAKL